MSAPPGYHAVLRPGTCLYCMNYKEGLYSEGIFSRSARSDPPSCKRHSCNVSSNHVCDDYEPNEQKINMSDYNKYM